jgi:DNA mismatch repair protein MutS
MAQLGSFVPAVSAKIGMVDRVFARIGASDDLHEGDSTFMVEMREAAQILSTATTRSLVLIDELGRGTATADGLALANAILEWLGTEIGARTLFATHFYELTKIAGDDSRFANLSVGSVEEGDRVVFTHQIQSGPARRSYGIEVAELSGLPVPVIERARGLLANPAPSTAGELPKKQISLFSAANASAAWNVMPPVAPDPVVERLRALSPDEMTPREAISVLYELCEAARANPKKRAVS